jgi:hypothetical protein
MDNIVEASNRFLPNAESVETTVIIDLEITWEYLGKVILALMQGKLLRINYTITKPLSDN